MLDIPTPLSKDISWADGSKDQVRKRRMSAFTAGRCKQGCGTQRVLPGFDQSQLRGQALHRAMVLLPCPILARASSFCWQRKEALVALHLTLAILGCRRNNSGYSLPAAGGKLLPAFGPGRVSQGENCALGLGNFVGI